MKGYHAVWPRIWLAVVFMTLAVLSTSAASAQEFRQILRGYEIAPVQLNLKGKDWALVGLGSYIVNTTGCNDCHTFPNWATGHNPFLGEPEEINTDRYLAGGRPFGTGPNGPIVSANITPDHPGGNGKPAGLTLDEFLTVMRTGHNPHDQEGVILQVMPWPLYKWKTELELTAMYEYLRAIPSCKDTTPPDSAKCKAK
jgi:hypothetical protein